MFHQKTSEKNFSLLSLKRTSPIPVLFLFFVDSSERQIPDEKQFDLENIIAFYLKVGTADKRTLHFFTRTTFSNLFLRPREHKVKLLLDIKN